MDFAAKHLSVTRSIVSQVVGVCKTEASQKPVRLHESLAQALLEWRRHTSFRKREDWVFASPHSNGKRPYWAQPIMRYHVAPASRRIQLQKRVGWHTFRHTFASRLLERGVDIMTVKELLGHSTVTVTMRYTFQSRFQGRHSRKTRGQLLQSSYTLHQNAAIDTQSVTNSPPTRQTTLELKTEEWVSG